MKTRQNRAFGKSTGGFTLIEIMITVAIIAILAALAVPNYLAYRKISHENACKENIHLIQSACEMHEMNDKGRVTSLADLQRGTYFTTEMKCPVGGTYSIEFDEQTHLYKVTCSKADSESHNVTGE